MSLFFFFQAEDGIRDYKVTGVQTCALPIFSLDEAKNGEITPATLERAASEMARLFDIRYGGFGTAPKFPHPAAVQFLLARWHDTREDWMREVVEKTLAGMAKGGIRDHVGGGFHRYAVDE